MKKLRFFMVILKSLFFFSATVAILHAKPIPSFTRGLSGFELSPDNTQIYAYQAYKNSIVVIDVASGKVINQIFLTLKTNESLSDLVFTADGQKIYFSTSYKNVFIIDTQFQQITGQVSNKPETTWALTPNKMIILPQSPYLLVIDSMGEKWQQDSAPKIHFIDIRSDKVVKKINRQLPGQNLDGWFNAARKFNHNASLLYFSDMLTASIAILNTQNNTLEDQAILFEKEAEIIDIALTPHEDKLYALSSQGMLYLCQLKTKKVLNKFWVGEETKALAENKEKLYIADRANNHVIVFDTTTNKIINTIKVEKYPQILKFSKDHSRLYVGNTLSNSISVINTANDTLIKIIKLD